MKKVIRFDTLEDAYYWIGVITNCYGPMLISKPLMSIWWIDNTLYGYLVFVSEDEYHCLPQDLVDKVQYLPDGIINTFV